VTEEVWLAERARLLGLAYRLLGSVSEAEDVLSEAYLRLRAAGLAAIDDPPAWLTTVVTRLCIDVLRSARARREAYVGPWLPEPIATGGDPADHVADAESVSMALLVVLESLSPLERAVFVLREVFAYDYASVAGILGRSEQAVRQMAHRAREHVRARRPRFEPDRERRRLVAERFWEACTSGQVEPLIAVLAEDVTLTSDGGGVVLAARRPLAGVQQVVRFIRGLSRQTTGRETVQFTELNAAPAVILHEENGTTSAIVLETDGARVARIWLVRNPAKLRALEQL
jgi:RNA polymerase sigma-70 factor, ECF subfamily